MPEVLVLDDLAKYLWQAEQLLRPLGVEVVTVQTVDQALRALDRHSPRLALVDIQLGWVGGGLEDSHLFVREVLIPRGLPFGRWSTDLNDLPADVAGLFQMRKGDVRLFLRDPEDALPPDKPGSVKAALRVIEQCLG